MKNKLRNNLKPLRNVLYQTSETKISEKSQLFSGERKNRRLQRAMINPLDTHDMAYHQRFFFSTNQKENLLQINEEHAEFNSGHNW
jgi:hypothetical protein